MFKHNIVNCSWSDWGEWSSCSHSCGRGLSISERQCNHPEPRNGGSYCTSNRSRRGIIISGKRHRVCVTNSCVNKENGDFISQRDIMCARFARSSRYAYVDDPNKPCTLKCRRMQVN